MGHYLTPEESHFNRDDRFRYEEDFVSKTEAIKRATERSLSTNKAITIMQNTTTQMFIVHAHGVEIVGTKVIAKYHKGEKIL
jgi:stalled ribosome rescue protein Dom34